MWFDIGLIVTGAGSGSVKVARFGPALRSQTPDLVHRHFVSSVNTYHTITGGYHEHRTEAVVRSVIASKDEEAWFVPYTYSTGSLHLGSIACLSLQILSSFITNK